MTRTVGDIMSGRSRCGAVFAPPDGRAGSHPVSIAKEEPEDVEALIAALREAARQAGVQRDDPMMPLLSAFARSIRFLGTRTTKSDGIIAEMSERMINALQLSRQSADSEIARFQAGIALTETVTIQRIADNIARAADRALTRRVTVLQWSRVAWAAAILVSLTVGSLVGGYWWGHETTLGSIQETDTGLQIAFQNGAGDARKWLDLMQWNTLSNALGQCTGGSVSIQDGRKACNVPLWIEPPQPQSTPGQ